MDGWFFGLFRKEGFPTQFSELKTAANTDVLETGLILAFIIVFTSFLFVIPGLKKKTKWSSLLWVTGSLFVGGVIMTSNFGQDWEVASIKNTRTPYKAGQPHEINAAIGMRIGLRSVNITLRAMKDDPELHPSLSGEIINYNEQFHWTWDQGRLGFGPFAGEFQREFRKAQLDGLPLPILWVADYFTVDGEGLRWGRFYRIAGWYTHITMWAAFPCWILANYFFTAVIKYGAMFTILTGALQVLACILWTCIQNPYALVIPFENGELKTAYGANYWLTLFTGIVCIVLGILIMYTNIKHEYGTATFFGVNPLTDYEEQVIGPGDVEYRQKTTEMDSMPVENNLENELALPPRVVYRRRATTGTSHGRWKRPDKGHKNCIEEQQPEDAIIYENVAEMV